MSLETPHPCRTNDLGRAIGAVVGDYHRLESLGWVPQGYQRTNARLDHVLLIVRWHEEQ
jgi:hypothetical protein